MRCIYLSKLFIIVSIVSLSTFSTLIVFKQESNAVVVDFGGYVYSAFPCLNGGILFVAQNVFKIPTTFFQPGWGTYSFDSFPPLPGKKIEGRALPIPVPCLIGFTYPFFGAPIPIFYYGWLVIQSGGSF